MIIFKQSSVFLSLEPISIEDWLSFNKLPFLKVEPILLSNLLISLVLRVHLGECEIVVALMFLPFHWDLCSSPHPNSIDFIVAFNSVNTVSSETVFSEVVNVSNMTILEVGSQISDNSFT